MAIHTKVKVQGDGFSMLYISNRLALCYKALKKPGKGGRMDRIQCAYFGFNTEAECQQFTQFLKDKFFPFAPRVLIRESDRLPECPWEVKVWEFPQLLEIVLKCHEQAQRSQQPAA
jgi:hypothetical protein